MIPKIPLQRQNPAGKKPFNDLVSYIDEGHSHEKTPLDREVNDILNYVTSSFDKATGEDKCLAVRTRFINDISTASSEMNEVSARNTRCKDPAYHFILSWPEHETPDHDAIFDAAEHALKALGLANHQAVIAIHGNTDNRHCHVAVNRINPTTFKSRNIEWSEKTLHLAARQSEIKHGWSHDNGIYIVNTNGHGKKTIELNPKFDGSLPSSHRHLDKYHGGQDAALPTWHDPESLESWLKKDVARALKRSLPAMTSWADLHTWLNRYDIHLTDTGGGGMRIKAASPETGEILDLPASRGLRALKRSDLETRFGPFIAAVPAAEPAPASPAAAILCVTPDLSHLTPQQLAKGVKHVLDIGNIGANAKHRATARRLDQHLLHTEFDRPIQMADNAKRLHDLSAGDLDGNHRGRRMLLSDDARNDLGEPQAATQRHDLRRTRTGPPGSRSERSLRRDDSKREERAAHRAAARADLRNRYAQYQRFVRDNDDEHWPIINAAKLEYRAAMKEIRRDKRTAEKLLRSSHLLSQTEKIETGIEINTMSASRQLQAAAQYEAKIAALNAVRQPPLSWRAWLHEQANLGDQAALSALRGMVYQAQRDAKKQQTQELDPRDLDTNDQDEQQKRAASAAEREYQYNQLMARLLENERKETAIRAARLDAMRPFEADSLLARYLGIKWRVTGNGNVEYSDRNDAHLFTDRGNRVTFDRAYVTDEEIRLALIHAQQKFGKAVTLTGDDPIFTARMARLASDMNIEILNPELQIVIQEHREAAALQIQKAEPHEKQTTAMQPEPAKTPRSASPAVPPAVTPEFANEAAEEPLSAEQRLRAKVLAIDPRANFIFAEIGNEQKTYTGPVAAISEQSDPPLFAQHSGGGVYTIHAVRPPVDAGDGLVTVKYANGLPKMSVTARGGKEKGR